MRPLALLLAAACGGTATNPGTSDPCASSIALQWGTAGDERPQHPRRIALSGSRLLIAGWDDIYIPTNDVEDVENLVRGGARGRRPGRES